MIRKPKRDYQIGILLAFRVVPRSVPLAGAHDSKGTVTLDHATGISGNSIPVETTMIVPTDTSGTSPTPTPIPIADSTVDFTVPITSKSVTARSAVQSLYAATSTPIWVRQTAPGWVSRICLSSVAMPDDSIIPMGGLERSNLMNDVWRSKDKGVTWTHTTAVAGYLDQPSPSMPNTIYGLIIDDQIRLPVNGATVTIWNTTSTGANLSFTYSEIDGIHWFENLPNLESYFLNANKVTYL